MADTDDTKSKHPSLEPELSPHPAAEKPVDVVDVDETYSAAEEEDVVRKIDITILPMV